MCGGKTVESYIYNIYMIIRWNIDVTIAQLSRWLYARHDTSGCGRDRVNGERSKKRIRFFFSRGERKRAERREKSKVKRSR